MKNVNPTPYLSPELEFLILDGADILTASDGESDGYVSDDNVDNEW